MLSVLCRRFDAAAFRAELKDVLRAAGIEGKPLLLSLEERHLEADPGLHIYRAFIGLQTPASIC